MSDDLFRGALAPADRITVLAARAAVESTWTDEEQTFARLWAAVKPDAAPLWWCLDAGIKAQFRPVAVEIADRLAAQIADWMASVD